MKLGRYKGKNVKDGAFLFTQKLLSGNLAKVGVYLYDTLVVLLTGKGLPGQGDVRL